MTKKKPTVKTSFSYASCTVITTHNTTCPMCGRAVQANTEHRCEKKS